MFKLLVYYQIRSFSLLLYLQQFNGSPEYSKKYNKLFKPNSNIRIDEQIMLYDISWKYQADSINDKISDFICSLVFTCFVSLTWTSLALMWTIRILDCSEYHTWRFFYCLLRFHFSSLRLTAKTRRILESKSKTSQ